MEHNLTITEVHPEPTLARTLVPPEDFPIRRAARAVETIDITPDGCKTPEGNARVNRALAHVDEANRRVAALATHMVDRLAANKQWQSDEHDVLKEAVQRRKDAYTALLRAVAGK